MLTLIKEGAFDADVRRAINANFASLDFAPGQTFWVDALNGVNAGNNGGQDQPFRTIARAYAACVSGRGDVIRVMPGSYDENLVISKDYVNLVGAVPGRYGWPDIVPSTGVALTVNAQGFTCGHCRFASTDDDVIVQRGNGFIYEQCVFDGDGNGVGDALVHLLPSDTDDSYTASEGLIRACLFRGSGGLGLIFDTGAAPAVGVGVTDCLIDGNIFVGNTGIDIVTADAGGGVYSVQQTIISNNRFEDKNKTTYIDLTTANGGAASDQTGSIMGNWFAADAITGTEVKMSGTGFTFAGNYDTVGIVDGSGLD